MSDNSVYNKFLQLPQMPYLIISELLENNENIWKLLKYNTPDALDKSNLSLAEKRALIYNGDENEHDFRVFTNMFIDDSFNNSESQLRVTVKTIRPENYIYGEVNFAIGVLTHNSGQTSTLNNYEPRSLRMMQEVIQTLNGVEINGIGKLTFNRMMHESLIAELVKFNKYFSGYIFYMGITT